MAGMKNNPTQYELDFGIRIIDTPGIKGFGRLVQQEHRLLEKQQFYQDSQRKHQLWKIYLIKSVYHQLI